MQEGRGFETEVAFKLGSMDRCLQGLVQRNNGLFIFKSDDLSRPKPLVQQFSASSQARQFHLGHFQEIATVHLRLHLKTASTHVWRISVACYWETNIESECLVQHEDQV